MNNSIHFKSLSTNTADELTYTNCDLIKNFIEFKFLMYFFFKLVVNGFILMAVCPIDELSDGVVIIAWGRKASNIPISRSSFSILPLTSQIHIYMLGERKPTPPLAYV